MAANANDATTIAYSGDREGAAEIEAAAKTAKASDMASVKEYNATAAGAKRSAAPYHRNATPNATPNFLKAKADVLNQTQPVPAAALADEVRRRKSWNGLVALEVQEVLEVNGFKSPSPTQIAIIAGARGNNNVLLHGPYDGGKTFGLEITALDAAFKVQQRSKEDSTVDEPPASSNGLAPKPANYIHVFKPTVLWVAASEKLAARTRDNMEKFVSELGINLQCCCGGYEYLRHAKKQVNVIIGTAGRLWDMIHEKRTLQLDNLEVLIMSEAWTPSGPCLGHNVKVRAILQDVALADLMHRESVSDIGSNGLTRSIAPNTKGNIKAIISTPCWTEQWLRAMWTTLFERLQSGAVVCAFWGHGLRSIATQNIFVDVQDAKFAEPHFEHPIRRDGNFILLAETLTDLCELSDHQMEGNFGGHHLIVEATKEEVKELDKDLARALHGSQHDTHCPTLMVVNNQVALQHFSEGRPERILHISTPYMTRSSMLQHLPIIMFMNIGGTRAEALEEWQALRLLSGQAGHSSKRYTFIDRRSPRDMELVKLLIPWLQSHRIKVPEFMLAAAEEQKAAEAAKSAERALMQRCAMEQLADIVDEWTPAHQANEVEQRDSEAEKNSGEAEKDDVEAEQNDGEAEENDGEAEKNDDEAEENNDQAEKNDEEAEKNDVEAEKNDDEAEKNDSEAEENDNERDGGQAGEHNDESIAEQVNEGAGDDGGESDSVHSSEYEVVDIDATSDTALDTTPKQTLVGDVDPSLMTGTKAERPWFWQGILAKLHRKK